jgi:hypothetical protein
MDDLREKIENMIAERLADHDRLSCQDLHELACAYAELEKNELLRRIANHKNECSCGGKK